MSLNVNDQLTLLFDLLDDHYEGCCTSVAEYEQIKRIVQHVTRHSQVPDEIASVLADIYNYGHEGESSLNIQQYTSARKQDINKWKHSIQQFSPQ
ncbi:MAG TPA: YtzH-like family protein [Bacillota bacterium]